MALKKKEVEDLRKSIQSSHRPLVFFDDDCDGLSSFLQVYKAVGDGRGIPVKDSPVVSERYARKAKEYSPDLVMVLDKPGIEQEFADKITQRIVWLDHHEPQDIKGVTYFNPRIHSKKDSRPTSYWLYKALEKNLWVAMTGVVADWTLPKDMAKEFRKEYPDLLPKKVNTPEQAIHDTEIGRMTRIWSFNLKGTVKDTISSVKVLTRIDDPYDILEQRTSKGRYIYRKYENLNRQYEELLDAIQVKDGRMLVFTYEDIGTSFTSDLSNEMLYRHPEKITIIGRIDQGFVKASLRSSKLDISKILAECLKGVEGYGGGHPQACGACVKLEDWDKFVKCFEEKV